MVFQSIKNLKLLILIIIFLILIIILIFYYLVKYPQKVKSQDEESVITDEYIITFENDLAKNNFSNKHRYEVDQERKIGPETYSHKFKQDKSIFSKRSTASLKKESGVKEAEPNIIIRVMVEPNDTNYASQPNLAQIKAPSGWEMETGDAAKAIAVIDTGVNLNHVDLNNKIWNNSGETGGGKETNGLDDDGNGYVDDWRGWDFVNSDNNPSDDHGHGTAVAGIAAAESNNDQGVAGVDWGSKIIPLKILDASGYGSESNLIAAINYAKDKGTDVINMSLGSPDEPEGSSLETAINNAYDAGVVLVAASGNTPYCSGIGTQGVIWPAAYEKVIAVGSINNIDVVSSFTCRGPELTISAPGENIYTTSIGGGYGNQGSGTSYSSPHTAGVVGLILAKYPSLTPIQVYNRLIDNADEISGLQWEDRDDNYGYGKLNIFRSLLRLVRGPDNKVWLISIDGTKKHYMAYLGTIYGLWRFSNNEIEDVDQGTIDSFSTDADLNYLIKDSGSNYYLIDSAIKKKFYNSTYVAYWGLSPASAVQFSDIFIEGFTSSESDLTKTVSYQNKHYLIEFGNKHQIIPGSVYSDWSLYQYQITPMSSLFLSLIPTLKPINRLAKGNNSSYVYLIDQGRRVYVPNSQKMSQYGFSYSEVAVLSEIFITRYPINDTLSDLVKGSGPPIYFLLSGERRWINSPDTFYHLGFDSNQLVQLSNYNLVSLRNGQKLTRVVKDDGPPIYWVENHTIRHIPTIAKFIQLGLSGSDVVHIPYSYLRTFPNGPDM